MTLTTTLTGATMSLARFGTSFVLKHNGIRRSAWLSPDDARAFYVRLHEDSRDSWLDELLSWLWNDLGYVRHSEPDTLRA